MEKEYDIIEIDNEEYVIFDEFTLNAKKYWLISKLQGDETPTDEVEAVRVEGDSICSIDDESEQRLISDYIESKIKENEND